MVKVDTESLLTIPQAAELRGISKQGMYHLLKVGKLPFVEIAGVRFVRRADVESFEPDKGGRPVKDARPVKGAPAKDAV